MNLQIILGIYAAGSVISLIMIASLILLDGKGKNWWKIPVYSIFWLPVIIKKLFFK